MTKKSPIKNLVSSVTGGVHRSTLSQLLDSASNAVQQGAQLSQHVVAASSSSSAATKRMQQPKDKSAAAPAEDYLSWTNIKRRQDIDRKTIPTTTTPPKVKSSSSGSGGVRVRDAIHMFDTAASSKKNTKEKKSASPLTFPPSTDKYASSYHATASFRHSPYRKHRGNALKKNEDVETKTNSNNNNNLYANDDDGINAAKASAMEHHRHTYSANHNYNEKENEINSLTNLEEKERHPLLQKHSKQNAPLAATVAAPTLTTTATSHASPKKSNRRRPPTSTTEQEYPPRTMLESVASKCTSSVQQQQHDSMKVDEVRGKSANNDVVYRSKQHGKKDEVEEAACMTVEQETTTTTSKKRESPTNSTSCRDDTTFFPTTGATTSKVNNKHHPLIQSPLRKHIKIVHDSACANASCTMIKEPFPLLLLPPPLQSHPQQQLSSGGNGEKEGRTTSNHLHTLDILTSNATATIAAYTTGHGMNDEDQDNEGCSTKTKEEAIDLLTSASFLFKQSRRKLG